MPRFTTDCEPSPRAFAPGADLVTPEFFTALKDGLPTIVFRHPLPIRSLSPDDARLLACSLLRLARESEQAMLDETFTLAPEPQVVLESRP